MRERVLVRDAAPSEQLTRNVDSAEAIAVHVQDTVSVGAWSTTPGVRVESIHTESDDRSEANDDSSAHSDVVLPGLGLGYQAAKELSLLAGVYQGFTPVAPGQAPGTKPELSYNYEAGYRFRGGGLRHDLIAFFNDYRNIKGTCSSSSGCGEDTIDREFDGGRARVYGVELAFGHDLRVGGALVPAFGNYTWTVAEFAHQGDSDNPEWGIGRIQAGDPLPYIPRHNLTLETGLEVDAWSWSIVYKLVGERYDQSVAEGREKLPTYDLLDTALHWRPRGGFDLYVKVDNALDRTYLSSLRPYWARPGMPRTAGGGVEYRF